MGKLFRLIRRIAYFNLFVTAGSWLGAKARENLTKEPSQGGMLRVTGPSGLSLSQAPITTHMLSGFILMLIGKPYWLMAFLGSFLASVLLGDVYDKVLLQELGKKMAASKPSASAE